LYLRAAGGRIPELKRVIVAHQNQIVMEETLDEALARLFPDGEAETRPPIEAGGKADVPVTGEEQVSQQQQTATLAEQARAHYERAIKAQREGNWALYGEEIRKLGEVLERMRRQ
jgi:uncharacterized membrane protein (UPF0182 family)